MPTFIKKFFENDDPISIQKVAASLFAIVLIRVFLEFFSSPDPAGFIFGWEISYLHLPLFYFSIFLSFTLLLHVFTRRTLDRIWNFLLPVFMLIWLPPVADLIATGGKGSLMTYILTEPRNFVSVFLKLLNPAGFQGITLGIHVAAALILLPFPIFIYKATKNFRKAALGTLAAYLVLFFYAILPSIFLIPYSLKSQGSAVNSYALELNQGLIQTTRHAMPLSLTAASQQDFSHSIFMSQIFWLFIVLQLYLLFVAPDPKYRRILKENFPANRIAYWSIIALIGIFLSQKTVGNNIDPSNITTLVSFAVIFTLGVLNTLFAICVNDAEDVDIDIVSNPDRPLVKQELSLGQWNRLAAALISLVVFGLATMNPSVAFFFILTQLAYYIYSARPLRLKRHFLSSSIIIGLASVTVALAGFFFVSPDQHLAAFPAKAIFVIGIVFALLSNMKDLKDFEGDRRANIRTMPVVFGLENAKKIIAFLYALVFVSVPLLLGAGSMIYFAVLCAVFAAYLFTKKQYQEKYVFLVLFFYAGMLYLTLA